ncbi:hypothetical protein [Pelagibacterium halotolerans]|uniref:hypothetical protein n=1 Tax=Pelagibacterium halotolerans TaxID=531813 RepID=UPI00384C8C99
MASPLRATQVPPLRHHLPTASEPANSRKTHSIQPVAQGFGLPGLSGAYRQLKPFGEADSQLLINGVLEADVHSKTQTVSFVLFSYK